jgi:hypothetical protein
VQQLSASHLPAEESSSQNALREVELEDKKDLAAVFEVAKELEEEVEVTPASGTHGETLLARAPMSKSTSGRLDNPQAVSPVSCELTPVSTSSASASLHSSSSHSSSASHMLLRWLPHKRDADGGKTVKASASETAEKRGKRGKRGKMTNLLGFSSGRSALWVRT